MNVHVIIVGAVIVKLMKNINVLIIDLSGVRWKNRTLSYIAKTAFIMIQKLDDAQIKLYMVMQKHGSVQMDECGNKEDFNYEVN